MMFGRRGIRRVRDEAELHPHRARFCEMFQRLEREHGVTHYLAHNMTVTPRNVDQVAGVIEQCRDLGFRMFSFQPAAFIGNANRWKDDYRDVSTDAVWARSSGAPAPGCTGARFRSATRAATAAPTAPSSATDTCRCSTRTTRATPHMLERLPPCLRGHGLRRGAHWCVRAAGARSGVTGFLAGGSGWARRFDATSRRRPCPPASPPRPVTFVMHSFMDARVVQPGLGCAAARGCRTEPEIREAQERLQACSYAMAHPEDGSSFRVRPAFRARPWGEPAPRRGAAADGAPDGAGWCGPSCTSEA